MRIKRYKLKDGITKEDLIKAGCKEGTAIWIIKEGCTLYKTHWVSIPYISRGKKYKFECSIDIGFTENLENWNDFDNIIVLDEDFLQPYTPFYGNNFGKNIKNFPCLEATIKEYNCYMDSLSFLEEVKE